MRTVSSSPVLLGFAALASLTWSVADAQVAYDNYPFVGCYVDQRARALPKQHVLPSITLAGCVAACISDEPSWKYAGLEYGQECFCGNTYDTYEKLEDDDCDMTLEADPTSGSAGGKWKISIYDLTEAVETTEIVAEPAEEMDETIGGDTDAGEEQTPVESGSRAFTVVNNCKQTLRIGSTGGRITFPDVSDQSSKAPCDAWGESAVYNPGPLGIGCYWDLPEEASGNVDRMLSPGESFRYNLHETASDTRWSGTIWASTGCDKVDGCVTGVCYTPDSDFVCPAYVGPGGPTTKAEFTLSDGGKDYYDVSNIDGANLPMMIEPDNPVFEEEEVSIIDKYQCGSPGSPDPPTNLAACTWSFEDEVDKIEENISQFLRLVLPDSYTETVQCTSDADCGGHTCGVHPQRWADGSYRGGVIQGSCGEHSAWVSAGGACAGGWLTGEFPDAFPFYCGESVTNGQRANMYGCHGGALAHSGYTPGADSTACGCPDWEEALIDAPAISTCTGINEEWVMKAQPWAQQLKKGCPTAYTFPYDDQTSTFMCADTRNLDEEVNTQSYTITFCPGSTEDAMYT